MRSRIVAATCIAALTLTACMSSPQHGPTGASESRDGAVISRRVQNRLTADPVTQGSAITVQTAAGGVVNLSGFVDTLKERNRALELARSVEGVKRVKDSLAVKKPADG